MAYFANGDEGDYYEARYCSKCHHQPENPDDGGCAVLLVHLLHNYDQEPGNAESKILSTLWPREGARNLDCRMFVPRDSIVRAKATTPPPPALSPADREVGR